MPALPPFPFGKGAGIDSQLFCKAFLSNSNKFAIHLDLFSNALVGDIGRIISNKFNKFWNSIETGFGSVGFQVMNRRFTDPYFSGDISLEKILSQGVAF